MNIKKMFAFFMSFCMIVSFPLAAYASSEEADFDSIPEFAITDDVVIIDSVSYEIIDNTIQYQGKTYEIEENYTLSTFNDEGEKVVFILPVEQNRVTDPEEIARLNAAVDELNRKKELAKSTRAIPSSSISLPYSENVSQGQWNVTSPAFDVIVSQFYYYTNLQLTNFPLLADRRFQVIFSTCDSYGTWTSVTMTQDFLINNKIPYQNYSSMRYGIFTITNLYGNPSPSYTYSIYLSNPMSS